MISVIRYKRGRKRGLVQAPGSKAFKERMTRKLVDEDQRWAVDTDPRRSGDNGYHTGRLYPLIDDEDK